MSISDAHRSLILCRQALDAARDHAEAAQWDLESSRETRAQELVGLINSAIHHCHRISFCVLGDLRAIDDDSALAIVASTDDNDTGSIVLGTMN